LAMILAMEVLPVPGGPNKMMDDILSALIILFKSFPSPMICS